VAVSGHDSLGRRFHAAHLDTAFRPSRYDLTKINRIRSGILLVIIIVGLHDYINVPLFSVADPGCLSRIPDPDFYPSRIPDPKTATIERGEKKLLY
jgi:hypothetical protein